MGTPFDQSTRPLRLSISGIDATAIMLTHFSGTEEISRLYAFNIQFVCNADDPLKFEDVLGKATLIEIEQQEGQVRFVHGLIAKLMQGHRDDRFQHYQAELVPPLWLLTRNKQSRIFQDDELRKVPEIIKAVIGGLYTPDMDQVSAAYPERTFTAQYRESDYDFISRLMEDEGIYYYFNHTDSEQLLVMGDHATGHKPLPVQQTLLFDQDGASLEGEGRITNWVKTQQLRIGAIVVTDYNFELPNDRLEFTDFPMSQATVGSIEHQLTLSATADTATVDAPGGYAWWLDGVSRGGSKQPVQLEGLFVENSRVANIMATRETSEAVRIRGTSSYRWLTPGFQFSLLGHFDADGDYVLVSVTHRAELGVDSGAGSGDLKYENDFVCVPTSIDFRPARITPKPTIRSTQTADVVGSEDAEIDPDLYGRVKVRFRWDPQQSRGLNTSCWVRVAQFWAGRNWGAQFIPRVGDEVIVAFIEGDPDRPIIIGSVYNANNMPIYKLPENKTKSGIKTHSSTGGTTANYNELFFEDKKGQELISIHAENNMTTHVENSYSLTVGSSSQSSGSDVKQYGKSTTQVYGDTSLSVTDGDYSMDVGKGKSTTTVEKTIEVTSKTDFIHVKSPKQINLNVNGTAICDMIPGQIKLSVGSSTFITMTNDTIHLQAAHIKINGTADVKLETPDLDCKGTKSFIHGANMKIQGTADAKFLSPDVTVTGDTVVTVTGGSSGKLTLQGTAELKGTAITVEAGGITTVKGSIVKVNC